MKTKFLFLIIIISFLGYTTKAQEVEKLDTTLWMTDFTSAQAAAAARHLPILLVFSGSDWCKPCIKFRSQILLTDTFSTYARDHFVMLNLDFPRKSKNKLSVEQQAHNDNLASKYNMEGIFPLVVIVDVDGKVLATFGYLDTSPSEYIIYMESLLAKK